MIYYTDIKKASNFAIVICFYIKNKYNDHYICTMVDKLTDKLIELRLRSISLNFFNLKLKN